MDKAARSQAADSPRSTAGAKMDLTVMMERFSQMQTVMQRMHKDMQELHQSVSFFRHQNAQLKAEIQELKTQKKYPPLPQPIVHDDPGDSDTCNSVIIKTEEEDCIKNMLAGSQTPTQPFGLNFSNVSAVCNCTDKLQTSHVKVESHDLSETENVHIDQGGKSVYVIIPESERDAGSISPAPDLGLWEKRPQTINITLNYDDLNVSSHSEKSGSSQEHRTKKVFVQCRGKGASDEVTSLPVTSVDVVDSVGTTTSNTNSQSQSDNSHMTTSQSTDDMTDMVTAQCGSDQDKGDNFLVLNRDDLEKVVNRLVTELMKKKLLQQQIDKGIDNSGEIDNLEMPDTRNETTALRTQKQTERTQPDRENSTQNKAQTGKRKTQDSTPEEAGTEKRPSHDSTNMEKQQLQDSTQAEAQPENQQPLGHTSLSMDTAFIPLILSVEEGEADYTLSDDDDNEVIPACAEDTTFQEDEINEDTVVQQLEPATPSQPIISDSLSSNCRVTTELSSNRRTTTELSSNCRTTTELSSNCRTTTELSSNCRATTELSSNCRATTELSSSCRTTAELSSSCRTTAELHSLPVGKDNPSEERAVSREVKNVDSSAKSNCSRKDEEDTSSMHTRKSRRSKIKGRTNEKNDTTGREDFSDEREDCSDEKLKSKWRNNRSFTTRGQQHQESSVVRCSLGKRKCSSSTHVSQNQLKFECSRGKEGSVAGKEVEQTGDRGSDDVSQDRRESSFHDAPPDMSVSESVHAGGLTSDEEQGDFCSDDADSDHSTVPPQITVTHKYKKRRVQNRSEGKNSQASARSSKHSPMEEIDAASDNASENEQNDEKGTKDSKMPISKSVFSDSACSGRKGKQSDRNNEEASTSNPSMTVGKSFCCYYCMKTFNAKLFRHLREVHPREPEVQEWLETEDPELKCHLLEALRNKGNYQHNMEVVRKGRGIVLVRRISSKCYLDYKPCRFCMGFYFVKQIKRHTAKCFWNYGKASVSLGIGNTIQDVDDDVLSLLKHAGKELVPVCKKLDLDMCQFAESKVVTSASQQMEDNGETSVDPYKIATDIDSESVIEAPVNDSDHDTDRKCDAVRKCQSAQDGCDESREDEDDGNSPVCSDCDTDIGTPKTTAEESDTNSELQKTLADKNTAYHDPGALLRPQQISVQDKQTSQNGSEDSESSSKHMQNQISASQENIQVGNDGNIKLLRNQQTDDETDDDNYLPQNELDDDNRESVDEVDDHFVQNETDGDDRESSQHQNTPAVVEESSEQQASTSVDDSGHCEEGQSVGQNTNNDDNCNTPEMDDQNIFTCPKNFRFDKKSEVGLADQKAQGILPSEKRGILILGTNRKNKKHFCKFCQKLCGKAFRHFQNVHAKEKEVQDMVNEKDKVKKRMKLNLLRRKGDHIHNTEVLKNGYGLFIAQKVGRSKKPGAHHTFRDFRMCSYCFGYYFNLNRHVPVCSFSPRGDDHTQTSCFDAFIPTQPKASVILDDIFSSENSAVKRVSREDKLVRKIGESKINRYLTQQNGNTSADTVRHFMKRQIKSLARLVAELQRVSEEDNWWLEDFIRPDRFSLIVTSVKYLSSADCPADAFINHRSVKAIRILLCARACALLMWKAKLEKSTERMSSITAFRRLCDSDWPKVKRCGLIDMDPKPKQTPRKPKARSVDQQKTKHSDLSSLEQEDHCSTSNSQIGLEAQQQMTERNPESGIPQQETDSLCVKKKSRKRKGVDKNEDTDTDSEDTECNEEPVKKTMLCPETGQMKTVPPKKTVKQRKTNPDQVYNEKTGLFHTPRSMAALSRRSWSDAERKAVFQQLSSFISDGAVPGKTAIDLCLANEPVLQHRSWRMIKAYCNNIIKKKTQTTQASNSASKCSWYYI